MTIVRSLYQHFVRQETDFSSLCLGGRAGTAVCQATESPGHGNMDFQATEEPGNDRFAVSWIKIGASCALGRLNDGKLAIA